MLVLSTDRIETLTHTYKTLFEQSEKLVKIAAQNFDKDGKVLQESGIMVRAEGAGIYAQDGNGNVGLIGVSVEETGEDGITRTIVKLQANHIKLEGLVTANNNFKVLGDGSIEAVNGKFSGEINATNGKFNGTVNAKNGVLNNVIINGAIRTPFRDGYYTISDDGWISVSTLGLQNNNNVVIPGGSGGWNVGVVIPWTSDYNGFRAIIMNDKWGSDTPTDPWSVTAPDGKYFYEDGQQKKTLQLPARSGVEMIGYGEGDNFKGWIILKRIYAYNHDNGFNLKVMFAGRVSSAGSLIDLKTYNGEKITVEKTSTGHKVNFEMPFSSTTNYMVFVSGYGEGAARYASVSSQTTSGFEVFIGDDSSANEGGFTFIVINTTQLYGFL